MEHTQATLAAIRARREQRRAGRTRGKQGAPFECLTLSGQIWRIESMLYRMVMLHGIELGEAKRQLREQYPQHAHRACIAAMR